ncbi:hypothetical protein Tco_0073955 [Tanacetum coccineum]
MPGAPATKGTKLGQRITNFVTSVRQDTNEIYGRLNEAHDARAMLSGESTEDYCIGIADGDCSVMSSRPRSTGTACGDTKTDKYTADIGDSTAGIARTRWRMLPEESDKIERYVGGLPNMIHGSVVASRPKIMQEAIEIETELMDKEHP